MSKFNIYNDVPIWGIMARLNGKHYQAVPAPNWENDCQACAFDTKSKAFCQSIKCVPHERKDGREIVFIRRKDLEAEPAKEV